MFPISNILGQEINILWQSPQWLLPVSHTQSHVSGTQSRLESVFLTVEEDRRESTMSLHNGLQMEEKIALLLYTETIL